MEDRLQKLIANAGIASRRKAEEMILTGQVSVNGQIVTELGSKADPERDHIKVAGKLINTKLERRKKVYILLNKPKGYLSSLSDPQNRPLVTKLIPKGFGLLHPIGRLDFNTEGLLIMTNDGDLTKRITTASEHIPKVYEVKVYGEPAREDIKRISDGIVIDGKKTQKAIIKKLEISEAGNTWYEVTLFEGRNNQIRSMFDHIQHPVVKLRRIRIGHLTSANLPIGKYRVLKLGEIEPFFKTKQAVKKVKSGQERMQELAKKGPARKRR
ncbi:MAG: rRNA pseudouridine synthase [Blastocatellia bacterium]|nr:rRNA pseudouridine synthase [Blastocatellia bacterium]